MKKKIFCLLILLSSITMTSCSKESDFYLEHKQEIDTYRYNHRNDWDGYQGTRRNSWAEEEKLKHDGYNPENYRSSHGY